MNIKRLFGTLLSSAGEKLINASVVLNPVQKSSSNGKTLIWDVVDGPFSREEFNEDDLAEFGIDDDDNFCLVVKLEDLGKVGLVNLWFPDEASANSIKTHFKYNIEPLELVD